MMFSKWLVATLLTDENVFQNAFASVQERSNGMLLFAEMKKAVKANFLEFYNEGTLLYFFFFTLGLTSYVFIKPCQFKKNVNAIILLGIGLMPFVWYSVLVNHSNVHPWMTYKILIITIYAVFSAVICCFVSKSVKQK